ITDPLADAGISEQRLANVLGLTAAERRVATALFAGKTPKEIAASLGLSFFTIRGHLVRIYEKTGVSRQADLIRVMTRLADTG
ncbi:MAG: helix-turn-helix transcriptional regulator, partial [Caulobacteraceae bacterium]